MIKLIRLPRLFIALLIVSLCACSGHSDNQQVASHNSSTSVASASESHSVTDTNSSLDLSSASAASMSIHSSSSMVSRDDDGDGVADINDYCFSTPIGEAVDYRGCPTFVINVAQGQHASQTSTYPELGAYRAIDGITTGDHVADQDLAHNATPTAGEWWQVDLGTEYTLHYSEWFNRSDCCAERMDDYSIFTSLNGIDWVLASHQQTQMQRPTLIRHPVAARYVRLVQNKEVYFNFAEVRIFADKLAEPPRTKTTLYAVNAGGSSYFDNDILYVGDRFYTGGTSARTLSAIAQTNADKLFQSERYGNFRYDFPVASGSYNIELHFAENYWQSSGKRLFDLIIEDQKYLESFDIFEKANFKAAYTINISDVYVNDGHLTLDFSATVDNAKIAAIRIIGLEGDAIEAPPSLIERSINPPQLELVARRGDIPGLNRQPASGRSLRIWALETHGDKVYIGYGDWGVNTGPIDIVYYDPARNTLVNERSGAPTEAIELFESINDELYVPMIDPSGYYGPSLMIQGADKNWRTSGTITWSAHTFDVTEHLGDLYIATGHWGSSYSGDGDALGRIYRSSDNGRTWVKDVETTLTDRLYYIGSNTDTIVASGNGIAIAKRNGAWQTISGGTAQPITVSGNMKMLMGSYFTQLIGNDLKFFSSTPYPNVAKWPVYNVSLPDAWSMTELLWVIIENNNGAKEIWATDNFLNWRPIVTAAQYEGNAAIYNAATALSYHNNALYIGLDNGDLYRLHTIFDR